MKYLNNISNIKLFEFEWYLRDYFFRANSNNSGEISMVFEIEDIVKTIGEKYFRYKTWTDLEIRDTLLKVLPILQKKGLLDSKLDADTVQLRSKLERRQCSDCYYVNCLGSEEAKKCLRCSSEKLVEFPTRIKR